MARGTLQTVFVYTPFDEVRRLGLRNETEAEVRRKFPNKTGMLVVSEVQRGSPAEEVARAGRHPGADQRRADGGLRSLLAKCSTTASARRSSCPSSAAARRWSASSPIEDLYSITPDQFLEFGDAVVHNLSWQQARHINVPISGVYVANPGYVLGAAARAARRGDHRSRRQGRSPRSAISSRSSAELKDGERVTVRFFTHRRSEDGAVARDAHGSPLVPGALLQA